MLKFAKLKINSESGVIIVYSILMVGVLLAIVTTLSALFSAKVRLSSDVKSSVSALYAAESGVEWCLFRKKDGNAPIPVLDNGATYEVNPIAMNYRPGDGGSFSSMEDASIRSNGAYANYNWGKYTQLFIGKAAGDERKILINFPDIIGGTFGQIQLNSNISKAILRLSRTDNSGGGVSLPINIYRLLKPWSQGSRTESNQANGYPAIDGEVTWNAARQNIVPWEPPGGAIGASDRSASIGATVFPSTADGFTHYSFDITSAVQDWADGQPNYGLLIEFSVNTATVNIQSSENANAAERPLLSVTGGNCSIGNIKSVGRYNQTTRALETSF